MRGYVVYREAGGWAVSCFFLKKSILVETEMILEFASDAATSPSSETKFGRTKTPACFQNGILLF